MKKTIFTAFGFAALTLSNALYAMNIDKMLEVADKDGNGAFVMANDKSLPYFIESEVSELFTTEQGTIERVKYDINNIDEWEIAVSNPRLVIEPGRTRSIGVKAICGDKCDLSEDKTFEVTLVPKPYVPKGEKSEQTVTVFVGYSAVFIIPAKEPKLAYDITPMGKDVKIHNKSNTMIKVVIDNCNGEHSLDCRRTYILIKGRAKILPLPPEAVGKALNVTVYDHSERHKEQVTVANSN
ncbi:hypothetical protein [Vibrio hippocampi]|uniref:Molecular chaperone n=1 Tax=Vibrio hippocampi TaxID=654686 RepID=A0ABM8ZKL0_9VIBR|nr:hypothetical protein [Vibrio hippocampi]CAH0527337.1 hypothetical protein VHP8226_02658 [Vibrio hippocampi]